MTPETQHLPVTLTQTELLARGRESGEVALEISQVHEELHAAKLAAKEKLRDLEARRRELDRVLRSGTEERDVACEVRFDFDAGTASTVRLDTGEIISVRPVTDEERQATLAEALFAAEKAPRRVREAKKKDDGLADFMARQDKVIAAQRGLEESVHTGRVAKKKARAA